MRPLDDADLGVVLGWRNHPRVRESSFTTHAIGWAEHRAWWAAVRLDPAREVLVYRHDGVASGVVAFEHVRPGHAEWGFYLDVEGVEERGQTLAAWLGIERAAIAHAFDARGAAVLEGHVLADNHAVLSLHRRFGFTEVERYTRAVDGAPRQVVRVRLAKPSTKESA
ncbi:GNAT family N-acetyltransferase [Streptosporangiaceae bacterium NEAU-GS5]|nr:GNAT family N-acetyltransferase [Streptosporangiaceae bacterium NEAU-GS5]